MESTGSFWLDSAGAAEPRSALSADLTCEVAVLGGGIAGVTTAYLLAEAGADVVLLEAATLGCGATGNTTAKISSAHGLRLARLTRDHGAQTAAAYARMNEDAIAAIAAIAEREGIDANLRRRQAYLYATTHQGAREISDEAAAAADAGLDAELVRDTPLPFEVSAALRVGGQAEFHPVRWLRGVAAAAERRGARLFEHSRATSVSHRSGSSRCVVATASGQVRAGHLVVATHYPTLDRGLFFARMSAERSLCLAALAPQPAPEGMYLSVDGPTRSLRTHDEDGREVLIVGGEGHKVGEDGDGARHAVLEDWARTTLGVTRVTHRWAAQDPVTPDGLPYVGAINPLSPRILVATGFAKWGMTNAVAAAHALRDRIAGRPNADAEILDANRFDPLAAGRGLAGHNASVARHFVADRLAGTREPGAIAPGRGAIVRSGIRRIAAHRDADGRLHAFSASCTHLGCELRFNDADRSWDCPCHGSRFDAIDGRVLEGPAVTALTAAELDDRPAAQPDERGDEMNSDALGTYLNDHLAGATLGSDHARQLAQHHAADAFGAEMSRIASEIKEDRDTLIELMERLGVSRNPVKAATAWVAEKAGRIKFSGVSSNDEELGDFLALETMSLGVAGKRALWEVLALLAHTHPELAQTDFARLIERADRQRAALEDERLRAAQRSFGAVATPV
jgi:glycine/D-amino acid oxidase-like deaminating enzyme/nitrite reductase/ring-hydroxylating ferredoxin subunit